MKTKLSLTLIILSISISSIHSQITTDRPDQTESSLVLSSGHVQIETGIAIEDSRSNINTLFRIGIIDGIEMRLNSNYLINETTDCIKVEYKTIYEEEVIKNANFTSINIKYVLVISLRWSFDVFTGFAAGRRRASCSACKPTAPPCCASLRQSHVVRLGSIALHIIRMTPLGVACRGLLAFNVQACCCVLSASAYEQLAS